MEELICRTPTTSLPASSLSWTPCPSTSDASKGIIGHMNEMPDDSRDEEFLAKLTPEQYAITRKGGTERAFTGAYTNEKTPGIYRCICCDTVLFSSEQKYDSGSGWPSFWQSAQEETMREIVDTSHGMRRIEVRCASCDAHLGHKFPDGPQPTGERYCINSASLKLEPQK